MREILEVIGQCIVEWLVYSTVDFAYGTKTKPPRWRWVYVLRICLLILSLYILVGLGSVLAQPTLDHLLAFFPAGAVIISTLASFLLPLIVAMGERRLGKTAYLWSIVLVWVGLISLGVWALFV